MKQSWEEEGSDGSCSFFIWKKFKSLKSRVVQWKQTDAHKWRNLSSTLRSNIQELDKEEEMSLAHSDLRRKRASLRNELHISLLMEEQDLKQRFRSTWLQHGERNTVFSCCN